MEYPPLGLRERYILALPPRILAVRNTYMCLMDEDGDESEGKELFKDEYGIAHYRINASAVGNYQIFKLADVWDTDIVVTDKLMRAITSTQPTLSNIFFSELEDE